MVGRPVDHLSWIVLKYRHIIARTFKTTNMEDIDPTNLIGCFQNRYIARFDIGLVECWCDALILNFLGAEVNPVDTALLDDFLS